MRMFCFPEFLNVSNLFYLRCKIYDLSILNINLIKHLYLIGQRIQQPK